MGAKSVDTSKPQATVEKKKLESQKKADSFEDTLYSKQAELSKQGLEATLNIGKKLTERGGVELDQLKNNTKILTSFFDSVGVLNNEQRKVNQANLSNLDKLFVTTKAPTNANFDLLQRFLSKEGGS